MSADEIAHKHQILEALKRRRNERELQRAKLGVNADPAITTELEDLSNEIRNIEQEILHLLQQASIHVVGGTLALPEAGVVGRQHVDMGAATSSQPQLAGDIIQAPNKPAAYTALWSRAEEIYLAIRTQGMDQSDFDQKVSELNIFAIRNSLHIETRDQRLINQYLDLVYELRTLANKNKRLDRQMTITTPLSADDFTENTKIAELITRIETKRAEILDKVRGEIRGIV